MLSMLFGVFGAILCLFSTLLSPIQHQLCHVAILLNLVESLCAFYPHPSLV